MNIQQTFPVIARRPQADEAIHIQAAGKWIALLPRAACNDAHRNELKENHGKTRRGTPPLPFWANELKKAALLIKKMTNELVNLNCNLKSIY